MIPPNDPRVAVVGATGAVGNQLVDLIAARGFPIGELKLFATESGAAQTVVATGEERLVEPLRSPNELGGFDIAFLAIPAPHAGAIIAASPGPILIDLSGASRAPAGLPMLAPGFASRETIARMRGTKVFTVPHPAAHALAACIQALGVHDGVVTVAAMLGASASGKDALAATVEQTADLLNARLDLEDEEVQCGFNIFVREQERRLAAAIAAQAAALLDRPPAIFVQAVAVPILHGTGLTIEFYGTGGGMDAKERLRAAPGILVTDTDEPLGVIDAVGQEAIVVSAEERPGSLSIWCVFDNARLAALDALWIAETFAQAAPVTQA
jgi:aspartate-semialdehyde dehydrogenase